MSNEMSRTQELTENQKADKKYLKKFIKIVLGAFFAGVAGGLIMSAAGEKDGVHNALAAVKELIFSSLPYVGTVLIIVALVIACIFYNKASKLERGLAQAEDEDEQLDKIEEILNIPLLITQILYIFSMFFMSFMFYLMDAKSYEKGEALLILVVTLVIVFSSWGASLALQKKVIDMEKRLNPEKQGSVYDSQFTKKWMDSCDEAQKLMIYKSAYTSFKTVNMTCMIIWIIALVGQMSFHTGFFPILVISAVLLANNLSYILTSIKLEKHK